MNLAYITANICSFKTRKFYPNGEQVGFDLFCPEGDYVQALSLGTRGLWKLKNYFQSKIIEQDMYRAPGY